MSQGQAIENIDLLDESVNRGYIKADVLQDPDPNTEPPGSVGDDARTEQSPLLAGQRECEKAVTKLIRGSDRPLFGDRSNQRAFPTSAEPPPVGFPVAPDGRSKPFPLTPQRSGKPNAFVAS